MIRLLRAPERARRHHEVAVAPHHRLGPGDAGDARDDEDRQRRPSPRTSARSARPRPAGRGTCTSVSRSTRPGMASRMLTHRHDRGVDGAAVEARRRARRRPRSALPTSGRDAGDGERAAGAVDRPAEHVVADVVGAEPVRASRGPSRATPRNVSFGILERQEVGEARAEERAARATRRRPRSRTPACACGRCPPARTRRRRAWMPVSAWASTTSSADMANPWVEDGVEQVDEEVEEDEAEGDHHDDALDDEEVLLEDGGADQRAEARQT